MFKKIVAVLIGLQFLTHVAGAATTYKICALPPASPVGDTDHFELSRNCGGSYNALGSDLATYILGKAPGSTGQLVFNSAGRFTAAPAATVRSLLGLATVAGTGNYPDLLNKPALATVATSGSYPDLINRPALATVATSGSYPDLVNRPALGSLAALNSISNSNWSGTPLAVANGGTGATTQSGAQNALGLVPGTNVQSFSNELAAVAGLSGTGYLQRTGPGGYSTSASIPLSAISGAGTAASASIGTSGANVGLLSGNNTASGSNVFSGANLFSGVTTHTALDVHNLNSGTARVAQAGAVIQVANVDGTNTRIESDAFGASAFFTGVRWDGTNATPAALVLGDEITGLGALGWNGTAVSGLAGGVRVYAGGAWSSTSNPTYIDLLTTPAGSTTVVAGARIQGSGGISVPATAADMGTGTINAANGVFQNGAQVATGAASSTDRTLPRFSGTGGKTLIASNIAVSDNDEISGYRELMVTDATTARTLAATDRGTTIIFTNSSAITVTLPATALSGFNAEIIQGGAGQITFTPASGATLVNAHALTKTFNAAGSSVRLLVTGNSGGSAAVFNLAGDAGQ